MEDLDLDELDQAVTKMMDKRGKKAAKKPLPATNDAAGAVPVSTSAPEPPKPAEPALAPPSRPPVQAPTSRPMPSVPQRRRMHPGAMDIIQPSAPPKTAAPSARASRNGDTIQPLKPVTPEPVAPAAPAPEPPKPAADVSDDILASINLQDEPKPAPTTLTSEEPKKEKSDWPDPLDFSDFDAPHKELAPEAPKDEPSETPPSMSTDALLADEPATENPTPFVTTKVEKRPLGAYANTPAPEHPVAETPEAEKPALVPDEATSKGDIAQAALHSSHHLDGDESDHDMNDLRKMSIPQQYPTAHHEPSSEVHSVFDTKEYHAAPQPVHPAKRGGGPGLVIAVVVLIVLIVAAVGVGYLMMTGFDVTKLF